MLRFYLLKGCYEWILTRPWIQAIGYSLSGLPWHIRLRIGIFHLSISEIVVHGRCVFRIPFVFMLLFSVFVIFLWFFVGWPLFLFLFSCLVTKVWETKNPLYPVYFLSDWSFNFIIFVMVELNYIILYYITKLHYSRLSCLIISIYLFSFSIPY